MLIEKKPNPKQTHNPPLITSTELFNFGKKPTVTYIFSLQIYFILRVQ